MSKADRWPDAKGKAGRRSGVQIDAKGKAGWTEATGKTGQRPDAEGTAG